jgi:hypothetical protein
MLHAMQSMKSAAIPPDVTAPDSSLRRRSLSLDDIPPEERDNPFVKYMLSMTPEQEEDFDRLVEAAQLYGDDLERSLEDIKAGRHPLQRGGRYLDAWERHEAELAAIRKKLGH